MNKSVVLDIDGVLADFEGAFCEKFGYNSRHLVSLEERYPEHTDEIKLFELSSATYERLDILPLGVRIANFCAEQGLDVYILSSRPSHTEKATGLWLKRNKIPFHFLEVGLHSKVPEIIRIDPMFVVDDMRDVIKRCHQFPVYSMLIDHSWNQEKIPDVLSKRIKNFQDFREYFEHISEVSGIFKEPYVTFQKQISHVKEK